MVSDLYSSIGNGIHSEKNRGYRMGIISVVKTTVTVTEGITVLTPGMFGFLQE